MPDDNKKNILFFEAVSMHQLYMDMESWQNDNQKRFLSMSIENDSGKFCCIALTNPNEVTLVDKWGEYVRVLGGSLAVFTNS